MGMCAEIAAVGPFSGDLVQHLEYGPEFYRGTRDGAVIGDNPTWLTNRDQGRESSCFLDTGIFLGKKTYTMRKMRCCIFQF